MSNVHAGHRERKRQQFLRSGADSFADHELLEMLMFYAMRQGDTNGTAHELMNRFDNNLQAVLSASQEELMEVPGVGESTAILIRLIPALYQRMLLSRKDDECILDTSARIGEFFRTLYIACSTEVMYELCLDAKGKKQSLHKVGEGDVGSVGLNLRQIVENALRAKAVMVVLAHNHPSGLALPSHEDQIATRMVRDALHPVGVTLVDHIIVADNDYVSMAESGLL